MIGDSTRKRPDSWIMNIDHSPDHGVQAHWITTRGKYSRATHWEWAYSTLPEKVIASNYPVPAIPEQVYIWHDRVTSTRKVKYGSGYFTKTYVKDVVTLNH